MIVVIAILGILAAVAIPRFAKVQTNAQAGANKSIAGAILAAADVYWAENRTEPTITLLVSGEYIKSDPGTGYTLTGTVGNYTVTYPVPEGADSAKYTGTLN